MKKALSIFTIFLLLISCIAFFATCHKEYSYEGGPKKSAAVYTLVGAGGACSGSVLAGNYYTGKALGTANTVQLKVNVTVSGSYNISTNTADGFQFSANGNFTNTGIQTVLLTGSGAPTAAGNFAFTAAAAGAGCTFSVTVVREPVIMGSFTIDCQSIVVNSRYLAGNKLTSSNTVTINVNVTAAGAYTVETDTLDGIYFSTSGVFSSTGNKSVTLNGYGTPDFARNLVFSLKGAVTGCTFTVTVTNPDPLAVYVLESGYGNPNPCIYTVNGNYTSHTALTAGNTVRINVFVTVTGNFTIATAPVNGIMFSYSGEFTTPGAQTVTLQGSGTPAASGAFSFIPEIVGPHPLGGQSCGFGITVQ